MIAPSPSSFVDIKGVSLVYGVKEKTKALDDLTMAIAAGHFVAVVGPSGCGKSSLMKLVTGLRPPTSGTIEVAGQRIDGPLKMVGMAFQNPTLLPWRRTISNVMLPMEIVEPHRHTFRADRKVHEARALALLKSVGLEGFATKYTWQLSGGMQQRASLCRALIHEPSLLMLDEPFGALDAFTREELWDVLQAIWMERKCTTILVTHDLREAVYLADKVFVMSARPGRIVATFDVSFERPRRPEIAFDPSFTDIVHHLREQIRHQRQAPDATGTEGMH
jgi:NitT/TauT family transport system ATP-binding protein